MAMSCVKRVENWLLNKREVSGCVGHSRTHICACACVHAHAHLITGNMMSQFAFNTKCHSSHQLLPHAAMELQCQKDMERMECFLDVSSLRFSLPHKWQQIDQNAFFPVLALYHTNDNKLTNYNLSLAEWHHICANGNPWVVANENSSKTGWLGNTPSAHNFFKEKFERVVL